VAKLAGLPRTAVERARAVLARFEAGKSGAVGLEELPLFKAAPQASERELSEIERVLLEIDADALSPREALELVYRLKALTG
jgi:DNA mismatch repair protein MutS